MPSLNSIVQVNITRDTRVPSRTGFGIPAVLSPEAEALESNRVTSYASDTALEELLAKGYTTASEVYKWAQAIVSQNPKVETLKVIKQAASVAQADTINIDTIVDNTLYTVTLDGVAYEYTSDGTATDAEIQAGLIALLDPLPQVSAVTNGTDKIDLLAAVAGDGYSLTVDSNMSITIVTANLGPVEEIVSARDEDDDWYLLNTTVTTNLQTLLIAAYIETEIKLFGAQTDEADTKDLAHGTDTTSLGAQLKALNYDRTHLVWTPTAKLGEYKQAAWAGIVLPKDPGSATWKFKSGSGISADSFTTDELNNLSNKNVNNYVLIAGISMFQEGVSASGEFIDIMRGTDWIQVRIQENVFSLLIAEDKVPYTDEGIEAIGAQVEEILERAVERNILVGDTNLDENNNPLGPRVTVPLRSETSKADRAARFLRDVKFTGNYAGAVHKTRIDGTLTV